MDKVAISSSLRTDFPALRPVAGELPRTYLDSAATTHKPQAVIDRLVRFYAEEYATVRRGVYRRSAMVTAACNTARDRVRQFLNAGNSNEIVFVRGATEGINLVARSYGAGALHPGDNVVVTELEHHANFVPWQQICHEHGAALRVVPVQPSGEIATAELERLLDDRTRLLAVTQVSNVLGTVTPVREWVERAHQLAIPVLVDGTQAAPRMPVDVQALDCDFYVFSGHKIYGPTGIGVVYGKAARLAGMAPYQTGGDMIEFVEKERTQFQLPPHRFEAGTPHLAGILGLATALDYVDEVGRDNIWAHEQELTRQALAQLQRFPEIKIMGTPRLRAGILSFTVEGIHPHDLASALDCEGFDLRAGHLCAQPLMRALGVAAVARISFGLYSRATDLDRLAAVLPEVIRLLRA